MDPCGACALSPRLSMHMPSLSQVIFALPAVGATDLTMRIYNK